MLDKKRCNNSLLLCMFRSIQTDDSNVSGGNMGKGGEKTHAEVDYESQVVIN